MILENYKHATAVTPSDVTTVHARALWVGGGGDVAVLMKSDTVACTIKGVAAGTLLPFTVTKVLSTGTTASNIAALL